MIYKRSDFQAKKVFQKNTLRF